jgi:hypothetical protein
MKDSTWMMEGLRRKLAESQKALSKGKKSRNMLFGQARRGLRDT